MRGDKIPIHHLEYQNYWLFPVCFLYAYKMAEINDFQME